MPRPSRRGGISGARARQARGGETMAIWDALVKRRGWDRLPALPTEQKSVPAPRSLAYFGPGTVFYPTTMAQSLFSTTDGAGNSAVAACLQAIASAIAEPELRVYQASDGERIELDNTELGALFSRPNPHFSLDTLLAYLTTSLHVDGNA